MMSEQKIPNFLKPGAAVLVACIMMFSCKKLIQYSPNEIRLAEADKALNSKNIQKIQTLPYKDTFRFVVIGDAQRFYENLDDFVSTVNTGEDVAFVLLNGDISDFGLNREFQWISRSLKRLRAPFIAVIGNHDMLANGRGVYGQMFGAENFSFAYSGCRFICLNTNSREVGFDGTIPDLPWLQKEVGLLSGHRPAFVFSHVPPFDADFDQQKANRYDSIMATSNKVPLSVHGHQHRYTVSRPYPSGVEYLVVSSTNKRNYALITVSRNNYTIEQKFF